MVTLYSFISILKLIKTLKFILEGFFYTLYCFIFTEYI